jgi:hypothetical protein
MAKLRSPNYPNRDLGAALDLARVIFDKDGRNKVSRAVIAEHLGHDALSGPALGKIGALRAYGLIIGSGDDLRVSEDAIAALMAPPDSEARREAIKRLALNPVIFQDIRKEFTGRVSVESLTYWLIQNGFSKASSPIAARAYFKTMEFAGGLEADNVSPMSITSDSPPQRPSVRYPADYPNPPAFARTQHAIEREQERGLAVGDTDAPFRITLDGKKLHIVADVDLDQLAVLKQMLDSYAEMLKLLQRPIPQRRPNAYAPGETIPYTGIYSAFHEGHHPETTAIHLDEEKKFPQCSECGARVSYVLAKKIIDD